MKKVALSLLALSVLAVGAFAEDAAAPAPALKFSGYLNAGVNAYLDKDGNLTYNSFAHDFGDAGSVLDLVGTYDATTSGYKFRLRFDTISLASTGTAATGSSNTAAINYAYAWYKPFAGLTVQAGRLADSAFYALDDNGGKPLRYLDGAGVDYTIAGLTVGGVVAASQATISSVDSGFGAKYALDKTFTVVGATRLAANSINVSQVSGSIDAVAGLTLTAGFYQDRGLVKATAKTTLADAYVAYAVTKEFTGSLLGYKYFDNSDYFDITPAVTYALTDAFTIGAKWEILTDDTVAADDTSTSIPGLTAAYTVGGAVTNGYVGYDITAKATKAYLDFVFNF